MKRLVLFLLVGFGLVGCAGTPNAWRTELDHQKIAAIERAALASGVKVIWLHAPTKPVREGS
jgi:hypothetical protein